MTRFLRARILCIALLASSGAAASTAGFPWAPVRTFDEAVALAHKEHKKLLVKVFATWCEPCKRLEARVFSLPVMRELAKRFVPFEVNADTPPGKDVLRRFGIHNYPTTLFLDENGHEETRIVGFREPPGFVSVVRQWLGGHVTPQAGSSITPAELVAIEWRRAFADAYEGKPQAERALRKLVERTDADAQSYVPLAMLALAGRVLLDTEHDPKAALEVLGELRRRFADLPVARQALWTLARARAAQGKARKGFDALVADARKHPADANAWFRVGLYALEQVQGSAAPRLRKRARKLLAQAARRIAHDDELWELVARLDLALGDRTAAAKAWKRAAGLRPDLPWYGEEGARLGLED